jgi:ADP-ribose pyrophosphatase
MVQSDKDDDMRWKVLDSKYLFNRPWLTARVDKVQLPTGAVVDEYYILEYPDWVNTIAVTRDGRFVFVRQYRHGLGKTVDELCAGVVEKGEVPEDAARRELLEETGFGGGTWTPWMQITANASTHTNLTHCFLATGVEPVSTQHLDKGEDIKVRIFTRDEVLDMLRRGAIWQSLMAAPLWKYFAEGEKNVKD